MYVENEDLQPRIDGFLQLAPAFTAIGQSTPVYVLLVYCDLCWFVSSHDDNLKATRKQTT